MTEQIQNQYHPDWVTRPGDTVAETLDYLGMTQSELARRTGRPIKTINEIINGRAAITPETALQFEKVLGVSARFWNNAERLYREHLARRADNVELLKMLEWAKRFPLREMVKFDWLPKPATDEDKVRSLLQFFGVASPAQYDRVFGQLAVAYRKSTRVQTNPYALAAWVHQGTRVAREQPCDRYDPDKFEHALTRIRALTQEPPDRFERDMIELCAGCGVAVALVRELPGAPVNGAARWLTKDKAVLQLSLRYKFNDIFWFSFFHEAAHILLHPKKESFIDCPDTSTGNSKQESQADQFAADCLIPEAEYRSFVENNAFSRKNVLEFANDLGIAPGIVVGRLQHDGFVPRKNLNGLKLRFEWRE